MKPLGILLVSLSLKTYVSGLPQSLVTTLATTTKTIPGEVFRPPPPFPPPFISRLHMTSSIQLRYARTRVESQVENPGSEASKVRFSLTIPDSAFISNFSMVTNEGEFVAEVKEKKAAEETFQAAVDDGRGAGLVSQDKTRDSNKFTVSTNVLPGQKVLFKLTYEELLERKAGVYVHALNINPGQVVDDLKVEVFINESLPIKSLSVPELIVSNELFSSLKEEESKVAVVTRQVDDNPRKAHIVFQPDKAYQEEAKAQGLSGQLLIRYDVDRKGQDSEVQVLDGYFVHYFVPDKLETLPKHTVFILDVSGSMGGEKLDQMKNAMFTVLDDMTEQDFFNIITFSHEVTHWNVGPEGENGKIISATQENKELAIDYVVGLNAGGSTNINQALLDGLELTKLTLQSEQLPRDLSSMIVFLTDGLPSAGVTDNDAIKKNVKNANQDLGISIFCIGFGRDADFALIRDISQQANSFAKIIYEGSDAALQLEGFFSEISSPLITNLKFSYVGGLVDNSSVSETELKTFFSGGEYVVAGKLTNGSFENEPLSVQISGDKKGGKYSKLIHICVSHRVPRENHKLNHTRPFISPIPDLCVPPSPVYPPRSMDQDFMQKLHAFINIKQLLQKEDSSSADTTRKSPREKALELSLANNFVTELTSLVVVQPGNEPKTLLHEEIQEEEEGSGIVGLSLSSFGTSNRRIVGGIRAASSQGFGNSNRRLASSQSKVRDPSQSLSVSYYNTKRKVSYRPTPPAYRPSPNNTNYQTTTTTITTTTTTFPARTTSITTTTYPDLPILPVDSLSCSGNITLFSSTYHRGENITLVNINNPDLGSMDNKAVTVKVAGDCCWRLFMEPQLTGQSKLVSSKETYTSVTSLGVLRRKVSSVRQEACY